jgi:hypothetical protein
MDSPKFANGFQYRCTDISCYVSKDGEPAIRMLRTEAQELQRSLGDTVEWRDPSELSPWGSRILCFDAIGIYTYHTKATIKLNGEMMSRDAAWRLISLSDKDLFYLWDDSVEWNLSEVKSCGELNKHNFRACEYQLRLKPAKVVAWTGSRDDVIALLKELELLK